MERINQDQIVDPLKNQGLYHPKGPLLLQAALKRAAPSSKRLCSFNQRELAVPPKILVSNIIDSGLYRAAAKAFITQKQIVGKAQ